MSHRSLIRLAALSLALAAVVPAESATLKGKAAFGDGAALPAGSVLRLTLQDMTSNGAIVVTGTVAARGKKAIGFRLKYDEDALEDDRPVR